MSASITSEVMTDDQKKQIRRLFEDAVNRGLEVIPLDRQGAQRVIGSSVQDLVLDHFRSLAEGQFADEEVESDSGYLSGFDPQPALAANLVTLDAEKVIFQGAFPELAHADYDHGYVGHIQRGEIKLPVGAERWTLVPRHQVIAPSYHEAFARLLEVITKSRDGKFQNYRTGQLGPDRLRQSQKSIEAWQQIEAGQAGHDLLVVPVQAGLMHAGKSVRRVREILLTNEFGLGAFASGVIILTHPERLLDYDDLWIDCAGDEYDVPDSDVRFDGAPCWFFDGGGLEFDTSDVGDAVEFYGSASGFVPQE